MSIHKTYAVFGLGRYGRSVARQLALSGAEVIAVDRSEEIVNSLSGALPVCKCADVSNVETLKNLGIADVDTVIVAMGNSLEASVMAIALSKELGVETVIAKCVNETQAKIFEKVGADKVVFPELESGARLAKNLLSSGFVDMVELSDSVSMVEVDVKDEWVGKSLIELNLRRKYSINVVAVHRGREVSVLIDPEKPLEKEEKLVVIANTSKLEKLK